MEGTLPSIARGVESLAAELKRYNDLKEKAEQPPEAKPKAKAAVEKLLDDAARDPANFSGDGSDPAVWDVLFAGAADNNGGEE